MLAVRKSSDRGHFNHGWLDTWHTFSFDQYHDPKHVRFRTLRVINEDYVAPGMGFGSHPHRDMEIVTYVVDGALEHKDSMDNGSVIRPGDVQRMTAGTGITHSEFNHSQTEPVHLLQIWVLPSEKNLTPGYEQKHFPAVLKKDRLCLIVSPDGAEGSVQFNQDARIYACELDENIDVSHELAPDRHGWVQVIKGAVQVNDTLLDRGDGVAISDADKIVVTAQKPAEFLLFDLG